MTDKEGKGIYSITNKVNNKRYIGQTITSFERRWYQHTNKLNNGDHSNSYLQSAWNKYGESMFSFEILEICEDEGSDEAEIFWIYTFRALNRKHGYNLRPGGRNARMSEESKAKLSLSKMGSQSFLGRRHTEETKLKLSIANKGRTEAIAKTIAANTGSRRPPKDGKFKGVYWDKYSSSWSVKIRDNADNRQKFIGRYDSEIDAAKVYDRAHWKVNRNTEFLNFPDDTQYMLDIVIPRKSKSSKYNGITKGIKDVKWRAKININGKHNNLGNYINEIDAAKAYDKASFEAFGFNDKLNFPEDYIDKVA